jgi:protein associated with RNAse G/E
VHVEDEDEFEIHQIKYKYTEEMIDRAVQETALIVAALKNREEPFFETAAEWLTKV